MSGTSPRRVRREGARQRARALPRHTTKHLPPTTDETSEGERRATSVRPLASNTARATTVRNGKRLHNKRSESVSARHQQTATRAASRFVGSGGETPFSVDQDREKRRSSRSLPGTFAAEQPTDAPYLSRVVRCAPASDEAPRGSAEIKPQIELTNN